MNKNIKTEIAIGIILIIAIIVGVIIWFGSKQISKMQPTTSVSTIQQPVPIQPSVSVPKNVELKQNPQVSNINGNTVYSYEPKYGELKGFSVTYQTDKWSLDDEESGAAMGMLFSKVNNNCAVLLNAGGHGMPLELKTTDEKIKLGENTARKRTWFDEVGKVVLVAITFGDDSTPYIFEFKPQLAVNQKSCIDGIMKVLATFKYLP